MEGPVGCMIHSRGENVLVDMRAAQYSALLQNLLMSGLKADAGENHTSHYEVVPVRRLLSCPLGNNGGSYVFQSHPADHSEYRRYVGRRRFSRGVYAPRSRQVHQPAGILPRDGRLETGKRF